jgi:hypothetical protein
MDSRALVDERQKLSCIQFVNGLCGLKPAETILPAKKESSAEASSVESTCRTNLQGPAMKGSPLVVENFGAAPHRLSDAALA